MSKQSDDTTSGNKTGAATPRAGGMQPRVARPKQMRRLREKSSLVVRSAAATASVKGDKAKQPKQGRLRQLKTTKQFAAKLSAVVGGPVVSDKVAPARPMQQRQFSAVKSFTPARVTTVAGVVDVVDKMSLARSSQSRQLGMKKQIAKSAVTV